MSTGPANLSWALGAGARVGLKVAIPVALLMIAIGLAACTIRSDWTDFPALLAGVGVVLLTLPLATAGVYAGIYFLLSGRR